MHAGLLGSIGAGPTRAATRVFALDGGTYRERSFVPDRPVYLIHAIGDADTRFAAGYYLDAIAAYREAIANANLVDWQKETHRGDGRVRLTGYALFRIAVASAARASPEAEVTLALDAVITNGKEPLFAEAATAFRRAWQERHDAHEGCVAATAYLKSTPDFLTTIFDYGPANPPPTYTDICPL